MKHWIWEAYGEAYEACRADLARDAATVEFAEEFAEGYMEGIGEKRLNSERFWELYLEGRENLDIDPFHAMHRAILATMDLGPGLDALPGSPFTRLEGGAK